MCVPIHQPYPHHQVCAELKLVNETLDDTRKDLTEKTTEMQKIKGALLLTTKELQEWGTKMTDSTPLTKLRTIHAQMKQEVKEMEVRQGVLVS
jgi:estrogen-related receptor beta like 1